MRNRPIDKRKVQELVDELLGADQPVRPRLTGATTPGGNADEVQDRAFRNPMTTLWDLIRGGESGGPVRIGVGTDGQVLTVQADLSLAWETPSSAGGQYRSPVYTTYGGGAYLFDANGDAIYVLEDLA